MLKYAKIINEETKQCDVGTGDPDAPYKTIVVPAVTHEEVIPAEYDEEGNLIKPEEVIVVVDEPEHEETMTVGDYYKSIGMEEMEVEQAYNGSWYVEGYAPEKPAPTYEEQKEARAAAYQQEVDPITSHISRLRDEEEPDEEKIAELKQERDAKVIEIQERYPYPEES